MTEPFSFRHRVYYEDTDASGVVYHARYLAFFERTRSEFLRALGFDQQRLMEREGIAFTLSDLSIRYRRPARLDDELIVTAEVERAGAASVQFRQRMWLAQSPDQLLAELSVRAGCVSYPQFQVTRMPAAVRSALKP